MDSLETVELYKNVTLHYNIYLIVGEKLKRLRNWGTIAHDDETHFFLLCWI